MNDAMSRLDFSDKSVRYDTFLQDLSARIVRMLHEDSNDPEYMSARQAYKTFGRKNVERWRREGKLVPVTRPNRTEYLSAQLRLLQRTEGYPVGRQAYRR